MLTEIPTLDRLLQAHAAALGADFAGYRNHTYRVANFCAALASNGGEPPDAREQERREREPGGPERGGPEQREPEQQEREQHEREQHERGPRERDRRERERSERIEKIAIAAACHDLGIWTDRTFDYLDPSVRLAETWLEQAGQADWTPEVRMMILTHHKISASRARPDWLVEPFRRADWIDVTRGALTCGLPRAMVRGVLAAWPNAGFHRRLVQLSLRRLVTHPLSPLPMMRL